MTTYVASLDGEHFGNYEKDNLKELIAECRVAIDEYNKSSAKEDVLIDLMGRPLNMPNKVTKLFVGESYQSYLDFNRLAEYVFEAAQDLSDEEDPEDYRNGVFNAPEKDIDDLASMLNQWFDKHNYQVNYFEVDQVREVKVND